ncbi:hypothetical protein [Macrococcoides caseolyticum]|uniref:hypothetical protein n=1 Tax=Macrococcoides caseolyticum TaxID=69966 RepID=UPI001F1CA4AF|nr:hypothetical protein [Macrococcus caseolyticus]MCE4957692.1 hypothetical protein [Macrococcus caseolyticus]
MTRRLGFLFNREGIKQCNVLPLKDTLYQIVKISDNPAIRTCGMSESQFRQFKKENNLYFSYELKQPDLFDIMAEERI